VGGARSEPDEGDVGLFPGRRLPDLLDVDLARDHVVPEADHDLREQLEPIAFFIRDQDAQMLGIAVDHGPAKHSTSRSPQPSGERPREC